MDYHGQTGADMLPEYGSFAQNTGIFSQPRTADSKITEGGTQQSHKQVHDKKAPAFELNVLQKSLDEAVTPPSYPSGAELPSYDTQPLAHRPRKTLAAHAKVTTNVPQGLRKIPRRQGCQIFAVGIPDKILRVLRAPTARYAYTFSATIKCKDIFNKFVTGETKASFLRQPIATGDWCGVLCVVHKRSGGVEETIHLYGKVTWEEFLQRLYKVHPTESCEDIASKDDEFPQYYWEYFNVDVHLLYGGKIRNVGHFNTCRCEECTK